MYVWDTVPFDANGFVSVAARARVFEFSGLWRRRPMKLTHREIMGWAIADRTGVTGTGK